MAEYIPTVREAVSQDPCLVGGETKPFPTLAKAMEERRRRDAERAHFEELSRYYRLEGGSGQRGWRRAFLAKEGKHKHDYLSHERRPTYSPPPSTGGSEGSPSSPRTCQQASSLSFGVGEVFRKC